MSAMGIVRQSSSARWCSNHRRGWALHDEKASDQHTSLTVMQDPHIIPWPCGTVMTHNCERRTSMSRRYVAWVFELLLLLTWFILSGAGIAAGQTFVSVDHPNSRSTTCTAVNTQGEIG